MRLLILVLFVALSNLTLKGQKSLSLDAFGTTFYATEGNLNIGLYYNQKLGERTSFQVGLSLGRYIREYNFREISIFGPGSEFYREFWGLAIIPEYRLYLQSVNDKKHLKGLFISPYGKAFLSWVNTKDLVTDTKQTQLGYVFGVGLGLGYAINLSKWTITPYFGLGKGVTSHQDIFNPGPFESDFFKTDLLIHRFEILIGYNF